MSADDPRSEAVVDAYKKDKLARSALRRVHALIAEFDRDREDDVRWAIAGVIIIVVLLAVAWAVL